MKKRILVCIVSALLLIMAVGASSVSASMRSTDCSRVCSQISQQAACIANRSAECRFSAQGANFVDADQDGVCDNRTKKGCSAQGANFVDADQDGVCDNRTEEGCSMQNRARVRQGGCGRRGNR